MKTYVLTLHNNYQGRIIVKANSKKESEDIGNKIITEATPCWFETGSQKVESINIKTIEQLENIEDDIGCGTNGEKYAYRFEKPNPEEL